MCIHTYIYKYKQRYVRNKCDAYFKTIYCTENHYTDVDQLFSSQMNFTLFQFKQSYLQKSL